MIVKSIKLLSEVISFIVVEVADKLFKLSSTALADWINVTLVKKFSTRAYAEEKLTKFSKLE